MSVDHYFKKHRGRLVELETREDLAAEEMPFRVRVYNNINDSIFYFSTLEEATAFYEKEKKEKLSGTSLRLYDHGQ